VEREGWNRRWEQRDHHCADDPVDVLEHELAGLPPGRALDLGCGAGRSGVWLAEHGWQVTGVDFSDVALGLARQRRPDVDWVLADLRDYEPERAAFDLVLVLFVHFPPEERRALLGRAAAALAPGGTALVVGHDVTNLGTGAPGPSSPEVLYTPDEVARELEGLEAVKAESVTRRVDIDGDTAKAVDTLVVARRRTGEGPG
jgi:SAM-dependent methyltransferase